MYRKLTGLALMLTVFVISSNAQFTKGQRMAGSSIASGFFSAGTNKFTFPPPTTSYTASTNSLGLSFSPNFGWFISDNLVVGGLVAIGYDYEKEIDAENNITFRKRISRKMTTRLGVFARDYFKVSGSFIPFGQLSLDAGPGSSSSEGFDYTQAYKETYKGKSSGEISANAGITAGVTKMLNAHTGLDIFIGYTYSYHKGSFKTTTQRDIDRNGTIDETGIEDYKSKISTNGVMFGVGLQVFLDKRKK